MSDTVSNLLDLAVRTGLLSPAQAEGFKDDLAHDSNPLARLVEQHALAPDEAELLQAQMEHGPQEIGPYQILRELGRGGMGVVYAARDVRLQRDVAVKVLRPSPDSRDVARFQREAHLVARLRHPRIVGVLDVGEHHATPYLVMPLVDGESLATRKLPRREAVAVIKSVAEAVHYAHEQGILHRDIKPENILVDEDGRGYLTDFGLAKRVGVDPSLTMSGAVFGTPMFMSPEQAKGGGKRVDRRTDVWSLGATLYYAITGDPPFLGKNSYEVVQRVVSEDPVWPRKIDPKIHPDLEAICLKALEKDPERRYATAQWFAEDLKRYLAGEPVAARPPGTTYRIRRWAGRYRIGLAVGLSAILLALVGSWIFSWQSRKRSFEQAKGAAYRAHREGQWQTAAAESERALQIRFDSELADLRAESRRRWSDDESQQTRYRWLLDRLKPYEELIHQTRFYFYIPGGDLETRLVEVSTALRELERLLEDPQYANYPEAWTTLGIGWSLTGDDARAEASLLRAIALAPDASLTNRSLGKLYLERSLLALNSAEEEGREEARRWSEKAVVYLSRLPATEEMELHLARAHRALAEGEKDEVIRLCDEGRKRFGDAMGTEEYGVLRLAVKSTGSMEEYTKPISRKPHYPLALLLRGSARRSTDPKGALADLDEAIRIHPRLAAAYSVRAYVRKSQRDREGALADYDAALRLDPDSAVARYQRAHLRRDLGDLAGALSDYSEVLRLRSDWAEAHVCRGNVYLAQGNQDAAMADYDQAIDLRPTYGTAFYNRGNVWASQGDPARAAEDFSQAIRLDPKDSLAYHNRGLARIRLKEWKDAVSDLDAALRLHPKYYKSYGLRGFARRELKDFDGAIQDCSRAIELAPDDWSDLPKVREILEDSRRKNGAMQ